MAPFKTPGKDWGKQGNRFVFVSTKGFTGPLLCSYQLRSHSTPGLIWPSVLLSGRHLLYLHGAVFHLHEGTRIPPDKYEIARAEGQLHRRRSWEDTAGSLSTFQNVWPQRISQGHRRRKTETTAFDRSMKILWPEALRSLRLGSPGAGAQHTLIPWLVVHKYGQEREFNYNFPVSLICVTSSLWHSPLPFCIILVTCQGLQG